MFRATLSFLLPVLALLPESAWGFHHHDQRAALQMEPRRLDTCSDVEESINEALTVQFGTGVVRCGCTDDPRRSLTINCKSGRCTSGEPPRDEFQYTADTTIAVEGNTRTYTIENCIENFTNETSGCITYKSEDGGQLPTECSVTYKGKACGDCQIKACDSDAEHYYETAFDGTKWDYSADCSADDGPVDVACEASDDFFGFDAQFLNANMEDLRCTSAASSNVAVSFIAAAFGSILGMLVLV